MKRFKYLILILSLFSLVTILLGCRPHSRPIQEKNQRAENIPNPTGNPTENMDTSGTGMENIREFDLEITFTNSDKLDYHYEVGKNRIEAEVERITSAGKEEYEGTRAINEIEEVIQKCNFLPTMNTNQAIESVLTALNINRNDISKLELEIDFATGEKLKAKL